MHGLLTALIVKHYVADFLLQTPYQYQNKGKLLHPGGLLHGAITVLASAVVLWWFAIPWHVAWWVLGVEFIVHYLTDLIKVRLNDSQGWEPQTHQQYFQLLGLDQMIHYLTYVWMVYAITGNWV